jgi:hypothetical protein
MPSIDRTEDRLISIIRSVDRLIDRIKDDRLLAGRKYKRSIAE